jgi:hypothetical protein
MVEGAARNIGNMDSMIADTQGQVDSLTSRIRSMPPSTEREQLRQERAVLYNDISSFEASKARSQAVLDKYSPY